MGYKKIILSYNRVDTVSTHKVLDCDCIAVVESQYEGYQRKYGDAIEIMKLPDDCVGLGKVKNYLLKAVEQDIIFFDDDVLSLDCLTRFNLFPIKDKSTVNEIVDNTYENSKSIGARCFGFAQNWDVRIYRPYLPFAFNKPIGGVMGVIGKDVLFDAVNKTRVDIDFCLKHLLKYRIIYTDQRYAFRQGRFNNKGGCNSLRTSESLRAEADRIKAKWGNCVRVVGTKTNLSLRINVKR